MQKKQKGFSLIEVMIVITLIAILVAIALPSYQKYTKRAHYMEVIQAAAPLKLAVTECYQLTGDIYGCKSGTNTIPPKNYSNKSLVNITEVLANGIVHVVPNDMFGIKSSEDYFLTPKVSPTSIMWNSSGGGVIAGYAH